MQQPIACLTGNIIDAHHYGVDKAIRRGTKHFVPGAKVYCLLLFGGMGHEQIRVLGKPRKSGRMIDVVMRTAYIKNFRVQEVYQPKVIAFIKKHTNLAAHIPQAVLDELNSRHLTTELPGC